MEFLNRDQINIEKWDAAVAKSTTENIFNYSWYLDATAQNWGALVSDNYKTILPIPFTKKIGIKQMYQAPFTRELDILGDDFNWKDALSFLAQEFKSIQFRNSSDTITTNSEPRRHQLLILKGDIKYSTNAKRLIKKAKVSFVFEKSNNTTGLIELFKSTAFKKIDSITEKDVESLTKLMKVAIDRGQGEIIEANEDGKLVGAGFFLKDKNRITYLKGASTDAGKKRGAMYGLIDFAINKSKDNYTTFDFGGSDIESVANFYKKFGAIDRTYYNYTINNLPAWFKALKRIKK